MSCNNTFGHTHNIISFLTEHNISFILSDHIYMTHGVNHVYFESDKFHLNRHKINRILHSWPFHGKLMKLAKDLIHKFHIK